MNCRLYLTVLVFFIGTILCGCEDRKSSLKTEMEGMKKSVFEKTWPVCDIAFSPDGRWLAAGRGYYDSEKFWPQGGDGKVIVWIVEDWKQQDGFSAPFTYPAQAIAFTSDGKCLVAAANQFVRAERPPNLGKRDAQGHRIVGVLNPWDGNVVFIWTVSDGKLVQKLHFDDFRLPNRGAGYVDSLSLSPDGELIGLGRHGSAWVVLQRKTGHSVYDMPGNTGNKHGLAFSPNGKSLVSVAEVQPFVHLYDAANGKEQAEFHLKCENPSHVQWFEEHGHLLVGDRPTCVRFSPDGKQIAIGVSDGSVRFLAADLSKQLRSLQVSADKERVQALAYAAKADLLAAATPSKVCLFEAGSGKQLREWGKADLLVLSVALSPDGKFLAVGYEGKHKSAEGWPRGGCVNIWDTATGRLVKKLD